MPWQSSNNGGNGSPWGGGSGGGSGGNPWNQGGGNRGGKGPGGFGGGQPPDFEDMIRKGQDRVKNLFPRGLGGTSVVLVVLLILLVLWLLSGFYRVQPDEQGVVLRFGQWETTTLPGLNWHYPYPIETVITPSVERINSIDIGFVPISRVGDQERRRDVQEESLMLTGDQNIIDIDFTVLWKIRDAGRFLFNIRDPEATVKRAAESAMREVIGSTDIQPALTESRGVIQIETLNLLQEILDSYEAGIEIVQIQLQEVQPPQPVIDAFSDVQRALQDRDRLQNEGRAFQNAVIPQARGTAETIIQEANAYKEQLINEAEGEAQRFLSVYEAYQLNPPLTKRRMYLETFQKVFGNTQKVLIGKGSEGIVPYLPLNELQRGRLSRNTPAGSQ